MARTVPPGLVAMSIAAIATIYTVGYAETGTAASALEAPSPAISTPLPAATQRPASPFAGSISRAPTATPTPTGPVSYQDGVYQGTGNSPRGGFQVAVTIADGSITDVKLTRVTTEYPAYVIQALPGQVIARQSAQVNRVSGATYSTLAFQTAVKQALAQAQSAG